ncbi:hypothetical protein CC2G_013973 [Coprinopsis cinerea AmutBmut pab1-1]|nr:hypothetical protein CC2G_013973 [Coprinopsis cinerea AmutBmut pab1-1]
MKIFPEDDEAVDTAYLDEAGKILYRVRYKDDKAFLEKLDAEEETFVPFAEVDSETIKIGGTETSEEEFFQKDGWSLWGKNRVFTGSDGHRYRWELRAIGGSQLFRINSDDSSGEDPVFQFHRATAGVLHDEAPACYEVDPSVEGMLDLIMVTYVFVETKREDRIRVLIEVGNAAGKANKSLKRFNA